MHAALVIVGAVLVGGVIIASRKATELPTAPGGTTSSAQLPGTMGELMNRFINKKPRGIRNNNPLNIRKSAIAWQGKTGDDGTFEIFDTPHNGIRAAARNLKTYANSHGLRTPRSIISRWAPAVENNVEAYVSSVAKRSGLFPDLILEQSDYVKLVEAMIFHENGQQPYDIATIRKAVQDGFA